MKEEEITRRLSILNTQKIPIITARNLRGGMQERLRRQERISYGKNIKEQKSKYKQALISLANDRAKKATLQNRMSSLIAQEQEDTVGIHSLMAQEKRQAISGELGSVSARIDMPIESFNKPVMRRVRSKRGFF